MLRHILANRLASDRTWLETEKSIDLSPDQTTLGMDGSSRNSELASDLLRLQSDNVTDCRIS
jgi:hypothetical protein